jgi:hypothetical protein
MLNHTLSLPIADIPKLCAFQLVPFCGADSAVGAVLQLNVSILETI